MRIVIVGGSGAGLFAALLLARAGHEIVIIERDSLQPAADVEAAAGAGFRAAAPQLIQPHAVLPRCRQLLREQLPDVYADLLAAGAPEAPLRSQVPLTVPDFTPHDDDEVIALLMARRSTLDWALQRAVLSQSGIEVREATIANGFVAAAGSTATITTVRTPHEDLRADLVIDAGGRRSQLDRWLADVGCAPRAVDNAECGLAYFSRHFRLRTSDGLPGPKTTRMVVTFDEFSVGLWAADNDVMQIGVMPLAEDKRFAVLRQPAVFDAVVRTVPAFRAWRDVLDPITEVRPMAGLHNTFRRLDPSAPSNLISIGDSVCTTNPTLGRGLAIALQAAADVVASLDGGASMREATEQNVAPYYRDQAAADLYALQTMRHRVFGAPPPTASDDPERVSFHELRAAAAWDAFLLRAFWQVMGMLALPETVYRDPAVVERTRAVLRDHGPAPAIAGPSRSDVAAALALAG